MGVDSKQHPGDAATLPFRWGPVEAEEAPPAMAGPFLFEENRRLVSALARVVAAIEEASNAPLYRAAVLSLALPNHENPPAEFLEFRPCSSVAADIPS